MMSATPAQKIEMIPISSITVINARSRNRKQFREIIDNIGQIGLKRPITVARRMTSEGPCYDLVCGQGRIEAFIALGQTEVPALVVNARKEDCYIASLVENCARRKLRAVDLLKDIAGMSRRGHSVPKIAQMTGLTPEYIHAIISLIEKGEERLLNAVECGQIPFSIALEIAGAENNEIQSALQTAYESKLLRGRKLIQAKRIVEMRRLRGKGLKVYDSRARPMSSDAILKAFEADTTKKKMLIKRADAAKSRLAFIIAAVKTLLLDNRLRPIFEEEGLTTIPEVLARKL
ncbi:plasmid partitioning protein RepB C-terminal domain-containing protein [Brucella sp. H1_1004]|uniref:ParB/RepB/Spo0J family partition protein n=1 Tax=Brucella sp. H1_1004 TaxID=3110109 RepID=UPI0039B45200